MKDNNDKELLATKPISADGLTALNNVLDVAVAGNMMSEADAKKIIAILHCNPAMRLTRAWQRLSSVEKLAKDLHYADKRLDSMLEECRIDIRGIQNCAMCSPFYMNAHYGEGGKKND